MRNIFSFLSFRPTLAFAFAVVAHQQGQIDRLNADIERAAQARLDAFTTRDKALNVARNINDLVA